MKKQKNNLGIGVLGLWHLGCVYATGLVKLGYQVEASDPDNKIVKNLQFGKAPIFEPGMDEIIKKNNNKSLNFVNITKLFKGKDYIFISYDLPVDEHDRVKTKLIDKTIKLISKYGEEKTVYVVSSQVPLGTCKKIAKVAKKIIYFPENVRLGKAYDTFLNPDRIILGSNSLSLMDTFEKDFKIFSCPFLKMSWESAEMVKHALNAYLATCVSFSSEISDLCEILGANMIDVVSALKSDRRVSPFAPINPGMGFAGATLGRDIKNLKYLGLEKNYKTKLFNIVYKVNQERLDWLLKKIVKNVGKLKRLNIGILGLTYKPGTNTLRRSMSLELADKLHQAGAIVRAYDPVIKENIDTHKFINIVNNENDFFKNLEAVVLMTEWPEFKNINTKKAGILMKNRIIFDTKNFLDKNDFVENKFLYIGTGI